MHELAKPAIVGITGGAPTHHHDVWKGRKQRIERAHIAAQEPADEPETVWSALFSDDAIGPLLRGPDPPYVKSGAGCHLRIATHHMRINGRKYDDVADIEPNRLALGWY